MPENATPTIHFGRLEILRSFQRPFTVDQYSTLNEKFNIGQIAPPAEGYPVLKYLAIGRGGHGPVIGANNAVLTNILQHVATHGALFEHIPFRMVPANADIPALEREKYRLRVLETHGGTQYFAYYLKVLDTTTAVPETRVITMQNSEIISDVPYVPSITALSPTPVDISNELVNSASGRHLVIRSQIPITLGTADINNIVDACTIKYGNAKFATISELALVSGFDIQITSTLGGGSATHNEIRSGQIMSFMGDHIELQTRPSSITLQYLLYTSYPFPPVVGS